MSDIALEKESATENQNTHATFLFHRIPLRLGNLPPELSPCAALSSQCHNYEFWEFFWLREYSDSL